MVRPHYVTHPLFNTRLPSKLRKLNIKPNFIKKKHQTRREKEREEHKERTNLESSGNVEK
jgi:hypothetical protein